MSARRPRFNSANCRRLSSEPSCRSSINRTPNRLAQPLRVFNGAIVLSADLKELEFAVHRGLTRFIEYRNHFRFGQWLKRPRRFKCLIEDLQTVATGYDHRSRQIESVV